MLYPPHQAMAWQHMNTARQKAYQQLLKNGVFNLYYLDHGTTAFPSGGTVDYTHPTNLDMQAYADAYEKLLRRFFKPLMPDLFVSGFPACKK